MILTKKAKILGVGLIVALLLSVAMLGLPLGKRIDVATAMTTDSNGNCDGTHSTDNSTGLTEVPAVLPGGDYHLLNNITAKSYVVIASNTTVNLCLNGFTLDMTTSYLIIKVESGATLNIYDCSKKGTGQIKGYDKTSGVIWLDGGALNLYGGTIYGDDIAINNGGAGAVNISGGTVTSVDSYAIYNDGAGAVTISGSATSIGQNTLYRTEYGILMKGGDLTMKDGAIYAKSSAIYNDFGRNVYFRFRE